MGNSQQPAMEMKSLICLVLAITGSLTAPMGQSHNQLGYGHHGEFMAPVPGTYQIAFTAIIDTLSDLTEQLTQAKFVVNRKQPRGAPRRIDSTTLTATTGRSGGDKVPVSRSLLLDLEAGEAVSIYQANPGAERSYHLTRCVHLIRPTAPRPWAPGLGDLTISHQSPEVIMPVPESEILFPETDFFKKISGTFSSSDPIIADEAEDPNTDM